MDYDGFKKWRDDFLFLIGQPGVENPKGKVVNIAIIPVNDSSNLDHKDYALFAEVQGGESREEPTFEDISLYSDRNPS